MFRITAARVATDAVVRPRARALSKGCGPITDCAAKSVRRTAGCAPEDRRFDQRL